MDAGIDGGGARCSDWGTWRVAAVAGRGGGGVKRGRHHHAMTGKGVGKENGRVLPW